MALQRRRPQPLFSTAIAPLSEPEFARLTQRLDTPTVEVSVPPPLNPKDLPPPPIVGPKGRCPNCGTTVSLHAEECFSCRAMFGLGSAWKVVPFG
jgi:hypothetical protein